MRALNIGATGMLAQQNLVETTANNLANVNSPGFKKSRVIFQDLIYENIRQVGTESSENGTIVPVGVQLGLGVQTSGIYRIHSPGTVNLTDNPLDLALSGRGFFQVELPSGETGYTRAGAFQLNSDGEIVTVDGYPLEPLISVPANTTSISIDQNGQVQVTIDGQVDSQTVGQLQLANFPNEAGLEAQGGSIYLETAASGAAQTAAPGAPGYGSILQGYLEASNVEAVEEITAIIAAQRAYEMNSKVVETADQMMATASNIR